MDMSTKEYCLHLNSNPIKFDPASVKTNVFYDNANRHVFSVRSGGAMGVVVKCPDNSPNLQFLMDDKGLVEEIKFSPDKTILGIQRNDKSVEFSNFTNGQLEPGEYSQSCKAKTAHIKGFVWTTASEVAFITDHGLELYQIVPEKKQLKLIKSCALQVNWYVYCSQSQIILLSSGTLGNIIHTVQFKPGTLIRQSRFEVDLPVVPKPLKLSLFSRDVFLAQIYRKLYAIVFRNKPINMGTTEIVLYSLTREGVPHKSNVLHLHCNGKFGIHFIDDLIIVHHQSSQRSLIFDLKIVDVVEDGISNHRPVVVCSIEPYCLQIEILPPQLEAPSVVHVDLYSLNWVMFPPDIIIDPSTGYLWCLELSLEPLVTLIQDKCLLIDFLSFRKGSQPVILKVCQDSLRQEGVESLEIISRMFDKLMFICKQNVLEEQQQQTMLLVGAVPALPSPLVKPLVTISQSDLYTHVFAYFESSDEINCQFTVNVLLEYVRALTLHRLAVPHYICKLLIRILVQNGKFDLLHQFLQYHILTESKPLACLLLSLQMQYPPAYQLALDMMKRLGKSHEEVVDLLISQDKILQALAYIRSIGKIETVSARKYLEIAKKTNNPSVFFSVFRFFEQRNLRLRGSKQFEAGEHCESYVKHFEHLFCTSLDKHASHTR